MLDGDAETGRVKTKNPARLFTGRKIFDVATDYPLLLSVVCERS
jgi:hypothetical protein